MAESSSSSASLSSVLSGKSDEEKEEMLDRMLTRLALCDDPKLQDLLSKLLPLSIACLSSPSTPLRNKVIEILSHVNKRVKHQQQIGLPLSELWKLYVESSVAPMIRNFCIMYIEMAIERVPKEEKQIMAPVFKVIGECHSTQISDEVAAKYRMLRGSKDSEIFLEFCHFTILYQPPPQSGGCPAGLSSVQCERITGKQPLKNDMLQNRKLGMMNILVALELPPELVYPLYISACADSQESVVKKAEEVLKKNASGVNLDDPKLINKLFFLFNGTTGSENISPESKVSPANPALRVRLMSIFCRSIAAANSFPSTLQCIFSCIFGTDTTSRLKQSGMEFTVWVFKHARMDQLKLMGPLILTGILKTLDNYSSPESDAIARETKTFCFQAIGLLAQRMPQLFREKVDVAVRLFDALKFEAQYLRLIVQEATNSLAVAYMDAPSKVLKDLELVLMNNSQMEQSEVRFCALRWATSLFDLNHCPSRFICMLGAADLKLDIREMALEGLFPSEDQKKTLAKSIPIKYPKLADMLGYILEQQPAVSDFSQMGDVKLLFPSKTYEAMIKFLLKCFEADVRQTNLDEDSEFLQWVERLCLLLEHAMAYEGSVELHASSSKAIITVGSHFPQMIASRYSEKVLWLRQFLGHLDFSTRESVARLLGIASTMLPIPALSQLTDELVSSISGTQKLRFEMQHGLLCALGYVTANCVSKTPTISESQLQYILKCLVDVVTLETATLASVAIEALGHIGLCIPLPPLLDGSTSVLIWSLLQEKLSKLLLSDDIKAVQVTLIALGHMCVKEPSLSHLNIALDLIFSLCRSKVEDILFAAGEALSFLWGGVPVTTNMILKTNYTSLSMSSNFLMGEVSPSSSSRCLMDFDSNENHHITVRDSITRKLFDVLLYSNRKEERCAGTVWLLSLTVYCGHHSTIQQLLPDIQEAFSHLLGEQNELTQDLASQGISIVYELGDDSMKKNLVNALVGALTGSGKRKRDVKLVEESEVFQEGSLGESPSGGKLSTYKELCSLANEMGQPDLIYKFMDLANHQASLNSKRGAAFGFSKIAKLAGDALQPHLRSLIPRLVHYQYDPDKNVQDAMTHIWKSLVADTKSTIDEYLDLIFDDLLIKCGSRLWRSREASCLSLADIIQGRKFDQVEKHLRRIWTAAFRAMDDIKETVRNAGDRLYRAVSSLTGRLCDVSLTPVPEARKTMDMILPLLLTEGIMSKVQNIRKASIGMVTKLAKGSGIAVRPHLPDLVCCMLESLSSLEDQGMNYVELHAANAGIQTEKLENLRISIAKGSPMWETLEFCIEVVDSPALELLVPRLAQLVRSGVGLNTRVGVANFISLLVQKVGASIKSFTNVLLKLLLPVVKEEKSAASKRAFASACAIILKYASPSQAQKLIEDTATLHSGDRNDQISCAILLKSYASMAADTLNGYHSIIVPIIFLSRFEDDEIISNLYEELWEENMPSERITLQLYLGEIVTLISEGIMSSSWATKKKASQATRKLSEVLGESLSSHYNALLTALMKELPGRLWEGKDALLNALSALCTSCHKAISASDPDAPKAILSLISSACAKKAQKYREAAFCCLEQVIKTFNNPDLIEIVLPSLLDTCNSIAHRKSSQIPLTTDVKADADEKDSSPALYEKIINSITACIHVARISDILKLHKDLIDVFLISLSPNFSWTVKMPVFSSIKELCSRLRISSDDSQDSTLHSSISALVHELFYTLSPELLNCLHTIKIGQVHVAAAECLLELTHCRDIPSVHRTEVGFKADLLHLCEVEKNEQAKSLLKKCIDILGSLEEESKTPS
ncbi:proteasome-associated ECM29 homolog isoform X1 [Olea europaea subsp. europaea]|uniref:Proteasome-associated ECM29 homolog isoform X1 n=1 Tax=Olea europaea subsp. europaea TaxID=158383 RepID=A0A8S0TP83_OLEEU|nr:proteasome-associated ECM29 homolog isoform X1 [Olea europaea subsp. europaea]